ncbi:AAA family ATPase [Heliobacterium mobile]|uniref:AAA family ATPase n=1 Tax=Heliobacterium mobile TaxID=28064 RepID=UPI0012D795DE|nr:AAA family ATPase [Heliobacterium mobile]
MNLKTVKIKNFRGFGVNPIADSDGYYIFDDLDKSFVILNGFNGFGKTSFFEAIEWCLTDEIKRIKLFEDYYKVLDLRKSHYLKFYHSKKDINREVSVELVFDNGLNIKRTTYCSFHKTEGKGDQYNSQLTVSLNNVVQNDNNKELLNRFIKSGKDPSNLLNTHFLGQENINAFIKTTDPESRREIFMQLMNLDAIESLFSKITKLTRSKAIGSSKKAITQEINTLTSQKNGINSFFNVRGWTNVQEYLDEVNKLYDNIKKKVIEYNVSNVTSFAEINALKIENETKFFEILEANRESLQKQKIKLQARYENLILINSFVYKIKILTNIQNLLLKQNKLSFLYNFQYEKEENNKVNKLAEITKLSKEEQNNNKSLTLFNIFRNKVGIFHSGCDLKKNEITDLPNIITDLKELWNEYNSLITKHEKSIKTSVIDIGAIFTNLENINIEYNKLDLTKKSLLNILNTHRKHLSELSTLNNEYNKALLFVKEYILNYNSKIAHCPICLNTNFDGSKYKEIFNNLQDQSIHEKIIAIIEFSLANGDKSVLDEEKRVTEVEKKLISANAEIKEKVLCVIKVINEVKSYIIKDIDTISSSISERQKIIATNIDSINSEVRRIDGFLERVKQYQIQIYGDELKEFVDKTIIDKDLKEINKEVNSYWNQVIVKEIPQISLELDVIDNTLKSLKLKEGVSDFITNGENRLVQQITELPQNIANVSKTIDLLDNIILYKIPTEYNSVFLEISTVEEKIKKLDNRGKLIEVIEKIVKQLAENISRFQRTAIEKQLMHHPIINWIYKSISPHPYFSEIMISNDGNGASFKDSNNEIFLDQIFSTAQLNVLALSIFLGLGISQKYTHINQLFLDDPIQSMDDVNVLAFVDVLRAIMDSNLNQKKIIISTHNDDFSKLLTIKMRNRNFVKYDFVSYGDEGPIIRKVVSNVI